MEHRVGAVLAQGLEDSTSVTAQLKLLDMFDTLLQRETVMADVWPKYQRLLSMYELELDEARRVFAAHRYDPPVHDNMPMVAGILTWSRALKNRVDGPMQTITQLNARIMELADAGEVQLKHRELMHDIQEFDDITYGDWCQSIDQQVEEKLHQPLLLRDEIRHLSVNFHPTLVRLLREAHYLSILQLDVPKNVLEIHKQSEQLRNYTQRLDMVVRSYNHIQVTTIPVELPLLAERLEEIDKLLQRNLAKLDWASPGISDFIDAVDTMVSDVAKQLTTIKNNVASIQRILAEWSSTPLLERRDQKKLLNLEDEKTRLQHRYTAISNQGRDIHKLLADSGRVLKISKANAGWAAYVNYVNDIVVSGLVTLVHNSINYLINHMEDNSTQEGAPLLEVKLKLVGRQLVFEPAVDAVVTHAPGRDNLGDMINEWVELFYDSATLIRRLDNPTDDYLLEVSENNELMRAQDYLVARVSATMESCAKFRQKFAVYSQLWQEDRDVALAAFLRGDGLGRELVLEDFEERIVHYEKLFDEVNDMEVSLSLKWLRIYAKPAIMAITSECRKWIQACTTHLSNKVHRDLSDLKSFCVTAREGMQTSITDDDYDQLLAAMNLLLALRDRADRTEKMFEPLRQTVAMLRKHGVTVGDDVMEELDEAPDWWDGVKKLSYSFKTQLQPLQAKEVKRIKTLELAFEAEIRAFAGKLGQTPAFRFATGFQDAYREIDQLNLEMRKLEERRHEIQRKQMLFELATQEFPLLNECRPDVVLLKQVWDVVALVDTQFNDWKSTPWVRVDCEFIEEETKKFVLAVTQLNKRARQWDCWTGLESSVRQFLTTLPMVADLRSQAMQTRHWKQLMQTIGVQFHVTDYFNLANMLELNLYEHVDDVQIIVERAGREAELEKTLKEMDAVWSVMTFQFSIHEASSTSMLIPSEELMEAMDNDQIRVQNALASKYVRYFEEQFTKWRDTLSAVDSVVALWLDVQRTWFHLETIFKGSPDIRAQLPHDTKRFDGVDASWKGLMEDLTQTPLVLHACTRPGVEETMITLREYLAECEHSLAEYLETKRRVFPRFYFVSPADLLDILSKGNSPWEVVKHMPKLTDNVASVRFESDADGPTRVMVGINSREEETVALSPPLNCTGHVEQWLSRFIDSMRFTLRSLLRDAVATYEDKPREDWLRAYPAQIVLVGTQIAWASEVSVAFDRLEEGNETALREYNKKQIEQLERLVLMLRGDLDAGLRQKIMTICTIEVHARDVVAQLVRDKAETVTNFGWQSQLRHRWDEQQSDCTISIADARFRYQYEYLGNTPRLVITPLTDRCYITLTQSLHLKMGGAPAGPAGTGKTETTKDLGRSIGMMVYVFNCSDQMDYRALGNIFKGLAASGAWGCFDEFNRISAEVLSVVATQVKAVLDALRDSRERFNFLGEDVQLQHTVGMFITMNPDYRGRTALPENIKALFRPVSMVKPDLDLICEIMLVAEGFTEAQGLAKKFTTLYALCEDLLSRQDHYDWGLRAIKSVLVVAGQLRRLEPDLSESQLLMRALRDFNIPKIVSEDVPVFLGLIVDLFPGLSVARSRNEQLEKAVRDAALASKLQAEESFLLKTVQLDGVMGVRHSVFVIGPPGAGKSQCWRVLSQAWTSLGRRTTVVDLNPKAVTPDELFGSVSKTTQVWQEGLLSTIMRDLANAPSKDPKWIVLDDDIDPEWIESLNSVMDDNRVLTLANNERIPLHPHMRLLFEVEHLRNATPATVSRAGILYLNENDVGWMPFLVSWIDRQELPAAIAKPTLNVLVQRYLAVTLSWTRKNLKYITPMSDFNKVQTLAYLLEAVMTPVNITANVEQSVIEAYFVFAMIWAFGSSLLPDPIVDYRAVFSNWWRAEWRTIKLPDTGTLFDHYMETGTGKWAPWVVPPFIYDGETPLHDMIVHNTETARVQKIMEMLMEVRQPVLLCGPAGCGKGILVRDRLKQLDSNVVLYTTINFNYFTDARAFQAMLEQPLERKTQRVYGPPGTKRLVYFLDDLNLPALDPYGVQTPHTLLRQHFDYEHWYDRKKRSAKKVNNVQFVTCMNPSAGSFTINPRLLRHFAVLSVAFPKTDMLKSIYGPILMGHMTAQKFSSSISKVTESIINAALDFHNRIAATFVPTAVKFYYQFNLRELTNLFGGLLKARPQVIKSDIQMLKLFLHEAQRVYGDRISMGEDRDKFDFIYAAVARSLDTIRGDKLIKEVETFTTFTNRDSLYNCDVSATMIKPVLEEALEMYNTTHPAMDLELFEDAVMHTCRIARIITMPRGHALLVGVGGSGKQSLTRLAAHVCDMELKTISVSRAYGVADFKADLNRIYMRAGVKDTKMVLLITDTQIIEEQCLVHLSDVLNGAEPRDLFTVEDMQLIQQSMRGYVRAEGKEDTADNCWRMFMEMIYRNLHVVFCHSPVGDELRVRARRFPALISCTAIDWFHPWPHSALLSVASRFLQEVPLGSKKVTEHVVNVLANAHGLVDDLNSRFGQQERRHNYTTPKSFLELIALFKRMLSDSLNSIHSGVQRLKLGLDTLHDTGQRVAGLQVELEGQKVIVAMRQQETDAMLAKVTAETDIVSVEQAKVTLEEQRLATQAAEVTRRQADCATDLEKAEPLVKKAEAALNTLNKPNLTELKSFPKPTKDVVNVLNAVALLLSSPTHLQIDLTWTAMKRLMGRVDHFLEQLVHFDKDNIAHANIAAVRPYVLDDGFNGEAISYKSVAAAGLCEWVRNIVAYNEVYNFVQPKRDALAAANALLAKSQQSLKESQARLQKLNDRLAELTGQFQVASDEKNRVVAQAERTELRLELAGRLIGSLTDERERWQESIKDFAKREFTVVADVLYSAAFISYGGAFTKPYREVLQQQLASSLQVEGFNVSQTNPTALLADEALVARWSKEGLPTDPTSVQNAAIVCNCIRWPLLIDPELQGLRWLRGHEKSNSLIVLRLSQQRFQDDLERGISDGRPVLIEGIGESIDASIADVVARNYSRRGRTNFVRVGDRDVALGIGFRLYLQTRHSNPHYRPEVQAQTTLVNFMVTEQGLEDQLLALVVRHEQPALEQQKAQLLVEQNEARITLHELEDGLLRRLTQGDGDILADRELITNLEVAKATSKDIQVRMEKAAVTEKTINAHRDAYRPVSARSALLYFLMNSMWRADAMYQFSLKSFVAVFNRALNLPAQSDDEAIADRVQNLVNEMTLAVYNYTARGLYERHKIVFSTMLCFRIMAAHDRLPRDEITFFVNGGGQLRAGDVNHIEWLSNTAWAGVLTLSEVDTFHQLPADLAGSSKRWKDWFESERPEDEKLPQEWKNKTALQKMCILRALRPDRVAHALAKFVLDELGKEYVDFIQPPLERSVVEADAATPIFFILSPGADPQVEVEALGRKMGMSGDAKFRAISLGQGQEQLAQRAIDDMSAVGGWVLLQNVHLMKRWLSVLETKLDALIEAHEKRTDEQLAAGIGNFRLFLTAEGSFNPEVPSVGPGITQHCITITSAPPQGMRANLRRALANFNQDTLENCSKQNEFRSVFFAMCFFHSLVLERRRFGAQGWNIPYNFNPGDLIISMAVLNNYLEQSSKVPWSDLRYMFGEIMYGGHIADNWDRRVCAAYLKHLLRDELLTEDLDLAPGFPTPGPSSFEDYVAYVDEFLPVDSPYLFGLHPNAEMDELSRQSEQLISIVRSMQPTASMGGGTVLGDDVFRSRLQEMISMLPENFVMQDIMERIDKPSPYITVCLQECARMNLLLSTIRQSLQDLDLGLKGELQMSDEMELLMHSLHTHHVPDHWTRVAYPSIKTLGPWLDDVLLAARQLEAWSSDLSLPPAIWLSGLFNPQAFLTAVMQTAARRNSWALDKMCIVTEVTKRDDVVAAPREGAFIRGLFLEGARWDSQSSELKEAKMKELFAPMPLLYVRAGMRDQPTDVGVYNCPMYRTPQRGQTYVWTFQLRTHESEMKWILAGVALLMTPGRV
eukprot:TRINITY_DN3147_c1_g1_i1.p1 TRINITY_DN3147_c1_g1~~TRINITY_DN3147_c1_g1_i1.p1  ORF type:complete len:4456 (-),score=1211.74 TRINITY_DN3147_c1_g1_i1:43-11907(-)